MTKETLKIISGKSTKEVETLAASLNIKQLGGLTIANGHYFLVLVVEETEDVVPKVTKVEPKVTKGEPKVTKGKKGILAKLTS